MGPVPGGGAQYAVGVWGRCETFPTSRTPLPPRPPCPTPIPPGPPFVPGPHLSHPGQKSQKNRVFHLSRLGELLNTQKNVHFFAPRPDPGAGSWGAKSAPPQPIPPLDKHGMIVKRGPKGPFLAPCPRTPKIPDFPPPAGRPPGFPPRPAGPDFPPRAGAPAGGSWRGGPRLGGSWGRGVLGEGVLGEDASS